MFPRGLRVLCAGAAAAVTLLAAGCHASKTASRATETQCPRGAARADDGVCRCRTGRFAAGPACTSFREATAYCGPGATMSSDGCAPRTCPSPQVLDVDSGECLPTATVRSIARAQGLADGITFACGKEDMLIAEGQGLRCIPTSAMARRCGAGEVDDAVHGRCVRVVTSSGDRDVLDAATWVTYALGPYGGRGSPHLCGILARTPARLARATSSSLRLDIEIDFPANEVSAARFRFRAVDTSTEIALSGQAERTVERAIAAMVDPLRSLGGDASSSTVATSVECAVGDQGPPAAHM